MFLRLLLYGGDGGQGKRERIAIGVGRKGTGTMGKREDEIRCNRKRKNIPRHIPVAPTLPLQVGRSRSKETDSVASSS